MKFSLFGKKKKAQAPKKSNPQTTLQAMSQLDKTMAQLEKRRTLLDKRFVHQLHLSVHCFRIWDDKILPAHLNLFAQAT